ncbi:magnesium transporter [Mucilaginibacter sp. HC2]|uniref:magnesium transporter n=1 Tax=Mucilaginibacter inviolabilis TaxID=2714892 RepID=UPI0014078CC2|nr:magnesium transporter [Mucilaginibacter inviolabilis]NHA02571.1 magnesium transporter [Mucilaginibacter inviolabilis]
MAVELNYKELVKKLKVLASDKDVDLADDPVCQALSNETPADIALALEQLPPEEAGRIFTTFGDPLAAEVLAKLEPKLSKNILGKLPEKQMANIINILPPREAAILITEAPQKQADSYVENKDANREVLQEVDARLIYANGSAGRLMTTHFVKLHVGSTVGEAIEEIRKTDPDIDLPEDIYIVKKEHKKNDRLKGVISIRGLLMADPRQKVEALMAKEVVSISAIAKEADAAALMAKHKFMTLPVTDKDGYLVGVIPADDMMQLTIDRMRSRYAKAVGTDAEAMEQLTPFQAAKKRVPWLLGTMFIELMAGTVISHFDGVLKKVILLASFMPVISAISGNVGLQAAAITVRDVDSGSAERKDLWPSIRKEAATAILMAAVCGFVLGVIGAIWSKHLPFGIVIGGALICSMLTAGMMGTLIPVLSKRLGFDPATTAGPFETAFQDVVGFAVFLWLATLLERFIA